MRRWNYCLFLRILSTTFIYQRIAASASWAAKAVPLYLMNASPSNTFLPWRTSLRVLAPRGLRAQQRLA